MNKLLLLCLLLFSLSFEAFSQGSTFVVSKPADKSTVAPTRKPGYKTRGKWFPKMTPVTFICCSDSTRYEYDALGNETSITFYVIEFETGKYYPLTQDVNDYDRNNRLLLKSTWGWHGVEKKLIETGRIHYTYGTGGAADSIRYTQRNVATGKFTNVILQTTKYNAAGEVTEWLNHSWENEKWKAHSGEKYIRTGATNGVFHEQIYQVYRNTGWSDGFKIVNTFTDGRVTEQISYSPFSGVWTPMSRQTNYTYGGPGAAEHLDVSYIRQAWSNNTWVDNIRYSYYTYPDKSKIYIEEGKTQEGWIPKIHRTQHFNAQGQLTSSVTQEITWHWERIRTEKFTYDEDGTLLEDFFYLEDNLQPDMSEFGRYGDFKTFSVVTGIPKERAHLATVYPNPTLHIVFVEPLAVMGKPLFIEAMDRTGKVLFRQEHRQDGKAVVDLGSYPPGLYFLRLAQGDQVQTHKVVRR